MIDIETIMDRLHHRRSDMFAAVQRARLARDMAAVNLALNDIAQARLAVIELEREAERRRSTGRAAVEALPMYLARQAD